MIEFKNVEKVYTRGSEEVHALKGICLSIGRGEFISITGPSGSGKTTLLHIVGCLDTATKGSMTVDGIAVEHMKENELVRLRREKIGFVFQQFYLIAGLTVYENIALPLFFSRKKPDSAYISSLIESVGLKERIDHKPNQLSGGEMQRVAIARALVNSPEVLLADEPTGNLDTENSEIVFELLKSLHKKGLTVIMVTHNPDLAGRSERAIRLKDGMMV
jgi:ABC-type lipoprotein export system ATPase subunit